MEGDVTAHSELRPSKPDIEAILPQFQGVILQAPPAFSAIKIDGERAYDLARAGAELEMVERLINIEKLALVDCPDVNHAVFEVACGKGTYVRSLARDMGRKLRCFGHVSMLRRVSVGPFSGGRHDFAGKA